MTRKGSSRSQTPLFSPYIFSNRKSLSLSVTKMVWPTVYDGKTEVLTAFILLFDRLRDHLVVDI